MEGQLNEEGRTFHRPPDLLTVREDANDDARCLRNTTMGDGHPLLA